MLRSIVVAFAVASLPFAAVSRAQEPEANPADPPRERLGARVAFTGTIGDLNEHFGNGYDFTLYFTEKLFGTFYLDIHIGATYFGDLLIPEIAEDFTNTDGIASEMRLAYLALGPQYTSAIGDTKTVYASLGLGIYTVSMLFDTGVQAFDLSDQHFGMNAGVGMYWRISDNWNIDITATFQTLWADENRLYHIFTGGGRNPLVLNAGVGVAMNLR